MHRTHRAHVGGNRDVSVAKMQTTDLPVIQTLLASVDTAEFINADLQRALASGTDADGTRLGAFTVSCAGQCIGAVVARSSQDGNYLRGQYALEDFILFTQLTGDDHMYLSHFVLVPIFQRQNKFVLREVMRLVCWNHWMLNWGDCARAVPQGLRLLPRAATWGHVRTPPSTPSSIIDEMIPVRFAMAGVREAGCAHFARQAPPAD
jgi:hypothetical protein